ncbi:MAG: bromoperoxidase [Pseudomonadota bacterium]
MPSLVDKSFAAPIWGKLNVIGKTMKLPYSDPDPAGLERALEAKRLRDLATETARLRPHALTRTNGEETDHGGDDTKYPANFTKGLVHDINGLVKDTAHYACFVEAINSQDRTLFDKAVPSSKSEGIEFSCEVDGELVTGWRGWESPRSGHVFELQGPDAGEVGMAPAPRVGSSELSAEMAEVYGLALLRDVPFSEICAGGNKRLDASDDTAGESVLSAEEIVNLINDMPFYSGNDVVSSTPLQTDENGYNRFERDRRFARTQSLPSDSAPVALTPENAFRGSTPGSLVGPYISQFLLIGARSRAAGSGGDADFDITDGLIPYGSIVIDQKTQSQKNCVDYMTTWTSWLDVQGGADLTGADTFEANRRFITTPRDLATYVHFDALYEAYLNAALTLIAMDAPASKGFPEPSRTGHRGPFATFGGPHILSLVTEVATRCLKAVRRQKFNYHRRARPEVMGGRLSVAGSSDASALGVAQEAFDAMLNEIPQDLRDAIIEHNKRQNALPESARRVTCSNVLFPDGVADADAFEHHNLLLPMAFPEGSPMHPAYGAGHATVAGGCVTMLKAFFEMFESNNSFVPREFRVDADGKLTESGGTALAYEANADGSALVESKMEGPLTLQGELDKLAANISIGRNMAGVHYYSDYYDSARMGERIALGILMEQSPTYGDYMETTLTSFDGDHITISGERGSAASMSIMDRDGKPVDTRDWWVRHVSGEEMHADL